MTLVLTINANSIWQATLALQCLPVVSTLAEATTPGQAILVATPVTLAELTTVLANSEQVLLAYEAPEAAIASLLQLSQAGDQAARSNNATPVQHAVQQWQQQITGLLTLQRQYRRKLKLLNLQQLAYASTEQLAELQPYWPLTQNVPAAATSIEQLAASQLLSQSPELSELNLLLQASSLALTELSPLDVQAALNSVEQSKAQSTDQVAKLQQEYDKQLAAANAEQELVLSQLLQVQEEFEQQYQQAQALQQQLAQRELEYSQTLAATQQQAEQQQADIAELQQQLFDAQQQNKAQVADLKSENELLLSQLMQVQEELEQYYLASQQHKQQLEQQSAESKTQLQKLQTEVKALTSLNQQQADALTAKQQEISQQQNQLKQLQLQLTAQHAELEQAVTSQQQQKVALQQAETAQNELQAENELLLTQLMNVQEELERYYLNFVKAEELQQQLQQQLRQLEQEKQRQHTLHIQQQKQQQREFSRLEQQFKKQKAELAGLKHSHLQLSTEFNAIRNSASWKVAAPVRLLTRAIKKVDKNKQRLQQDIGLLFTSEFFDADWYLNTYPDVKDAGANPAEHYLKFGAAEGRRPSAEFDGNWYLQRYPDVAQSGVNPLLHYIKFGRNEGRTASPKLLEDHSDHKTELQG